jgi:hypothetical protein
MATSKNAENKAKAKTVEADVGYSVQALRGTMSRFARAYRSSREQWTDAQRQRNWEISQEIHEYERNERLKDKRILVVQPLFRMVNGVPKECGKRMVEYREQEHRRIEYPERKVFVTPDALAEFIKGVPVIRGVRGEFAAAVIENRASCPNLMREVAPVVVGACNEEFGMFVQW